MLQGLIVCQSVNQHSAVPAILKLISIPSGQERMNKNSTKRDNFFKLWFSFKPQARLLLHSTFYRTVRGARKIRNDWNTSNLSSVNVVFSFKQAITFLKSHVPAICCCETKWKVVIVLLPLKAPNELSTHSTSARCVYRSYLLDLFPRNVVHYLYHNIQILAGYCVLDEFPYWK